MSLEALAGIAATQERVRKAMTGSTKQLCNRCAQCRVWLNT